MLFFAVFLYNEEYYRKSSKVLVVFMSFFVLSQYYYSLKYMIISKNKIINERCLWFKMYDKKDMPDWKVGSSLYFRHTPYPFQWFILISMSILNSINQLYSDKNETTKMQDKVYEQLREIYS